MIRYQAPCISVRPLRISHANSELAVMTLAWVFVIEATTFYIHSNLIDNVFQVGACLLMAFLILCRHGGRGIYVDRAVVLYLLLSMTAFLPDIINGRMAGVKVGATFVIPLVLVVFITDFYYMSETVSGEIFVFPLLYSGLISLQGIILEATYFAIQTSILSRMAFIEKTGNYIELAPCGMGGFATWGSAFGRALIRIQGHYIEPSKMAAFLLIPILLAFGFYKRTGKLGYLALSGISMFCLLLTMSRAGFVALACAVVFGALMKGHGGKRKEHTTEYDLIKMLAAGCMILVVAAALVFTLVALSRFFPSLEFLHIGITNADGKANLIRQETVDPSHILNIMLQRPLGYGFSGNLHIAENEIDTNLANALMLWLVTGGIFGALLAVSLIAFIMLRYAIPAMKSPDPIKNAVGRIFVGLSLHSLSYGTWMTPDFLIIVALLIAIKGKEIKV